MSNIKLNQLAMLVAVVDAGSFSKAAAALDCTQSRISHAIGELEKHVGKRLLVRAHAGSVVTDDGRRVLHQARQILALVAELETPAIDAPLAGAVRLACFRSIGTHVVPYALQALARRHPGIEVTMVDDCDSADDVHAAVLAGRAELGIGCAPYEEELVAQPLLADDYVLVLPSGLALKEPLTWDQLAALPLIEPATRRGAAVIERMRADGLRASAVQRMVADSSIMSRVALGQAYSVFQHLAAFPAPPGVRVVPAPLAAQREFAVVALPHQARNPLVRALSAVLRDRRILSRMPVAIHGIVHLRVAPGGEQGLR